MAEIDAAPAPAAPVAEPAPDAAPAANGNDDVFQVDEQVLASLSPEIRQTVVDPILTKVKTQVQDRMKKNEESLAPFRQKAQALEKLIADPKFQKWYYDQQNPAPAAPTAKAPDKPAISAEEWNHAYEKAANGDLSALNSLQEKQLDNLVQQKYAPILNQVATKTRELEMSIEMNDLFSNHPDAKDELDKIRMDPNDSRSPSLLEFALHYVSDKGGKSFEDAYQAARRMADQMKAQSKAEALNLVQSKKNSVTEQPARSVTPDEGIVYVDTPQEALRMQLQATMKNQNVTYRVRPRQK